MTMLVDHVKSILDVKEKERMQRMGENPPQQPKPSQNADAITADAREKVAKLLFGPKGESNATPAMKRLLTSWVSMGYPGKGKAHQAETGATSGTSDFFDPFQL